MCIDLTLFFFINIIFCSCVLRGLPFYFALVLPVVLVLIGNTVVLVLVLRGIKYGSQLVKDSKAAKNKKMTHARIAFACAVLLGLTWAFAILAIGELKDFFQWMFCIFNSLQGFFIFVFYTLRSNEVRREWKRFFGFGSLENNSTSGSSKYASKYISGKEKGLSQSKTMMFLRMFIITV